MPPLTDLAKASTPINARLKTAEDVHRLWLRKETPMTVAAQMLDYANKHDLDLSEKESDIYPIRTGTKEGDFGVAIKWTGIERICRATGLWMPGKVDCRVGGDNTVIVYATCYSRFNAHSNTWLEVSACARLNTYFDRDMTLDDPKQAKPTGEWLEAPEIKLEEIAQYLAAVKVFGDYIYQHTYPPGISKSILHGQMIRRRQEAGEEQRAAAAKT